MVHYGRFCLPVGRQGCFDGNIHGKKADCGRPNLRQSVFYSFREKKDMKGMIRQTLKKVTLEHVYQVVDERTTEIVSEIKEIKNRQEDDFRYLMQKIDADIGQLRSEVKK